MARNLLGRLAHLRDRQRDPALTVLAGLLVFILFGHLPLAATGIFDPPVLNLALVLLVVVAIVVVARKPVAVGAVLLAGLIGALGSRIGDGVLGPCIANGAAALFLLALSWVVADAVFAPGRITVHRVLGAVVLYLNAGALFLTLYMLLTLLMPAPFSGVASLSHHAALRAQLCYFSFTTLTSAGYGDILPLHPLARGLANVEAILGQLFPATFLARIVTLELAFRRGPARKRSDRAE